MPFIHATIVEGRTPEMKEQLISELTETASRVLQAPKENVRIQITELPPTHWGIAGQSIAKRKEEKV
jgi:4-oxalocrotonate tautomerase